MGRANQNRTSTSPPGLNGSERPHWLRTNDGTRIPGHVVFLDTETDWAQTDSGRIELHRLRLGVAIRCRREGGEWTRRQVFRFTTPDQFWNWLDGQLARKRTLWLFAHNLGFDLTIAGFWNQLEDGRYHWLPPDGSEEEEEEQLTSKKRPWKGAMVTTSPPTIICVRNEYGTLRMVDTVNYWKMSLASMGQACGLEKLPMPRSEQSQEDWFAYCQRDVEILERTVCTCLDRWEAADAGCWQTTAAGLSWAAFRHKMPAKSILIDHQPNHTALARNSYHGGQAEAYFVGQCLGPDSKRSAAEIKGKRSGVETPRGPFYCLDVRSLYPHVMHQHQFPVKFIKFIPREDAQGFMGRGLFWLPIAQVRIKTDTLTFPVMHQGRLIHAHGDYWTTLAGPELDQAFQHGLIVDWGACAWYLPGRPFADFVEKWYQERLAAKARGDWAHAMLCKLILNSLSGKWAQHAIRWTDAPKMRAVKRWGEWNTIDAQSKEKTRFRAIAGQVQEFSNGGEGRYAFPAISSFITSYGRCFMAQLRALCPDRSILYQDTDSLIVTNAGLQALESTPGYGTDQHGALRCDWISDSLEIVGPKHYVADKGRIASGLKAGHRQLGERLFSQAEFQSLNNIIQAGPCRQVIVTNQVLTYGRQPHARALTPSGWTRPLQVMTADEPPF